MSNRGTFREPLVAEQTPSILLELERLRSENHQLTSQIISGESIPNRRHPSNGSSTYYNHSRRASGSNANYVFRRGSATSADAERSTGIREQWKPMQVRYVQSYLKKCSVYMETHEEAHRYYRTRHYWLIIPATILGIITSGAAFATWRDNALSSSSSPSWALLVVGVFVALSSILHNLSEFVLKYKIKAEQHKQSYSDYCRLVREVANELNNPDDDHRPYRQFLERITDAYGQYAEQSNIIPSSIKKKIRQRWQPELDTQNGSRTDSDVENNSIDTSGIPRGIDVRRGSAKPRDAPNTQRRGSIMPREIQALSERYSRQSSSPQTQQSSREIKNTLDHRSAYSAESAPVDYGYDLQNFVEQNMQHLPMDAMIELSHTATSTSGPQQPQKPPIATFESPRPAKNTKRKKKKKHNKVKVSSPARPDSVLKFRSKIEDDNQVGEEFTDNPDADFVDDEAETPNELDVVTSGTVKFTSESV